MWTRESAAERSAARALRQITWGVSGEKSGAARYSTSLGQLSGAMACWRFLFWFDIGFPWRSPRFLSTSRLLIPAQPFSLTLTISYEN
jgi:hypothetical protein